MAAFSLKNSSPFEFSLMRPSSTARSRKVGPSVNGRIADKE